jgi:hypothetical protein
MEIEFTDPRDQAGTKFSFFITIMPYLQMNLGAVDGNLDEGFKLDQPLDTFDQGQMLGTVDVTVNDLFTVGFKKNAMSFRVSTLKDFGPQLTNILKTWQFD